MTTSKKSRKRAIARTPRCRICGDGDPRRVSRHSNPLECCGRAVVCHSCRCAAEARRERRKAALREALKAAA